MRDRAVDREREFAGTCAVCGVPALAECVISQLFGYAALVRRSRQEAVPAIP
ncbi:hypothetical protein [Phytoactinopolyspora halophila]|uniref:hypothetical protein n=1 Tax=Phytoactinopolyspora halophila TaxID=1981511 RepID=UPI001314AF6A|nr:hypothetical protein [Phytoactinopolyspora halophila]